MKWSDNDIDNLYKAKASSSSFEYKDAYWKEMEAMLPKTKGKDFFWVGTSILFLGLVTFSFLQSPTSHRNNDTQLVAKNAKRSSLDISHQMKTEDKERSLTTTKTQKQEKLSETKSNDKTEITSSSKHIEQNSFSTQYKDNTEKLNSKKNATQANNNSSVLVQNQSVKNKNFEQNIVANNPVDNNTKSTIRSSKTEEKASIYLNTKEIKPIDSKIENLSNAPLPAIHPVRSQFYAQLLGGMSQSMVVPSNAQSYNLGAGLGWQMNKGRFVFNSGINAIWSLQNNIVLNRQAKIYSFGSDVVQYEIKYKEFFQLEADLSVGYQFSKHILRVGVRPSYIIGTKVGYRETINNQENTENFYGLTQGIHQFGIKPMIGYTYLLKRDFSIGINFGVQLMPLIDKTFVDGMNRSFPIDGQLFLRKTIHFRK